MKYYLMIYNYIQAERQNHIGSIKTLNNTLPRYSVCSGEYVENWDPNITIVCDDESEKVVPDWLSDINAWLVVSERFVDTVKPFENGAIQYLPIKVNAIQPQMKDEKFYVANVIRVLDVVDFEKSDWHYMGPNNEYRCPITYTLKKNVINDNHIFIIKDDVLSEFVVVSEDLKNVMVKNRLLGFGFVEVEVV